MAPINGIYFDTQHYLNSNKNRFSSKADLHVFNKYKILSPKRIWNHFKLKTIAESVESMD